MADFATLQYDSCRPLCVCSASLQGSSALTFIEDVQIDSTTRARLAINTMNRLLRPLATLRLDCGHRQVRAMSALTECLAVLSSSEQCHESLQDCVSGWLYAVPASSGEDLRFRRSRVVAVVISFY